MRNLLQIVLLCFFVLTGCKEDQQNSGTPADQVSVAKPVVVGALPATAANNNNPQVYGTSGSLVIIKLYSDSACATQIGVGNSNGSGQFAAQATVPDDATTNIYAKAFNGAFFSICSTTSVAYIENSDPNAPPTVNSVLPAGPANNNSPVVTGNAYPNVIVKLFSDNTCATEIGSGTANAGGVYNINAAVANNSTTTIYGRSTNAGVDSICSPSFVTYVEDSTAPTTPVFTGTTPASPAESLTPSITGTAEANSTVSLYTASNCSGTASYITLTNGAGNFSVGITVSPTTTVTYYGRAVDAATNTSPCTVTPVSYTQADLTAPNAPVMSAVTPAGPANNNAPAVVGTAEASSTIKIYTNSACSSAIAATGAANGAGNFSLPVSVLNNTTTGYWATSTDANSNTSVCSTTTVSYIEDSIAPSIPVISAVTPAGPANNNSPLISGTAEANSTINFYSDSACSSGIAGTGVTDGSGNFSIAMTIANNTTTSYWATATDVASNISSCSTTTVSYIEDSINPSIPVISSITPVGPANNNAPVIAGTAEANSTIKFYTDSACSSAVAGTGTANGAGNYSITMAVAADTTQSFWATATDVSSNASACSTTTVSYTEDSISPVLPVLSSITPAGSGNNNAPVIAGTAEANSTIKFYTNSACSSAVAGTGAADGAGNYSIAATVLDNTTTSFWATATDVSNNASACSTTTISYIEDSVLPAIPVISSITPVGPANNNAPVIAGTAEANSTIKFYTDSACSSAVAGTGTANGAGNFSITMAVAADTTQSFWATATDAALNASACSTTTVSYTEDSTAPSIPVISAVTPAGPANNNAPVTTGTAEANSTVKLYTDSGCSSAVAGTVAANGGGAFSISTSVTDNTTTSYWATATDASLNVSACSTTTVTYIEDSIAPAIPVISTVTPVGPADSNSPTIAGTAEASSTIKFYTNNTCTSGIVGTGATGAGTFSLSANAVDNTTTTYWATATDAALNVSGCSTTSIPYTVYSIPEGMAYLQSTTTTAPSTNTNLNQATAYSFRWTTSEFHSTYFSHSTVTNPHQLQVKVAGDYFLNLTVPVTVATANVSIRTQVRVNGTAIDTGQSESSFISSVNGHRESSNHLAILIPNLSANDLIDVTVIQAGAAATLPTVGTTMNVEYINPTRNIFFAKGTQTTNSTNLNQATAYSIQWTDSVIDGIFTHSNITNTQNIQFGANGHYLAYINVPVSSANTAQNVRLVVRLNGAIVSHGRASQGFIRGTTNVAASIHWVGLLPSVLSGDVLTVEMIQEAAAGTVVVYSTKKASIFIEEVGTTGVFFSKSTLTTIGTNWNATGGDTARWSTVTLKDNSYYTHSTGTNPHQITLSAAGDYLVNLNIPLTSTTANTNAKASLRLNGTAVTGAESKSSYISTTSGHNEGSNALSFLLRRNSGTSFLDVFTFREGNTGTMTTNGDANIFIQYKPNSVSP